MPWPNVVNKYLGDLHSWSQGQNQLPWLRNLSDNINGNRLTWVQIQAYEQLEWQITVGKLQAEHHCWKLKMNQVPWIPELTKALYWLLYWKGVIVKAKGQWIGTCVLQSWTKKGGLSHKLEVINQPDEQLEVHLAQAYLQYHRLKNNQQQHNTWIGQLVEVQAATQGCQKFDFGNKLEIGNDSSRWQSVWNMHWVRQPLTHLWQ